MKRDPRLRGLSSDHHHALVLARAVVRRSSKGWSGTDAAHLAERLRADLEPHFRVEEEVLLPALRAAGAGDLCQHVERDHALLRRTAASALAGDGEAARAFGEQLAEHVRFEERDVFPACEALLDARVLDEVARRAPKQA